MLIFKAAMTLVEEWANNFTLHFTGYVITNPCLDNGQPMLVKMVPFDFVIKEAIFHSSTTSLHVWQLHLKFVYPLATEGCDYI